MLIFQLDVLVFVVPTETIEPWVNVNVATYCWKLCCDVTDTDVDVTLLTLSLRYNVYDPGAKLKNVLDVW
jgi:hypothetical protein